MLTRFGKILDSTYSATTAITSDDLYDPEKNTKQATVYVFATTAGTAQIQWIDEDLVGRNLTAALAVSASDLTVVNFAHIVPRMRVVFTPTTQPGTVEIAAYQY